MGKKSDKMYITNAEWTADFGGAKKQKLHSEFKKLPFSCCSLSLLPFENPVCTPEGHVFSLEVILPWLKKFKTNPINGLPLSAKDLIKMNWSTSDSSGEYQCPITFKVFNDHTHIVMIRQTGNVFSMDAIEELNIRSKFWKDLIDDVPFTRKDIITIQDPHQLASRDMTSFDFIKKGMKDSVTLGAVASAAAGDASSLDTTAAAAAKNINQKGSVSRILEEMKPKTATGKATSLTAEAKTPSFVEKEKLSKTATNFSSGAQAYAFTSMAFTPVLKAVATHVSELDVMFKNVTGKGAIQIKTNLGDMHFELYCQQAPRTCYNMIKLAAKGYYDNCKFHRSIRNFMLQGGDPTGKGTGGESIYGGSFVDEFSPLLTHRGRGILSMANKGKDTNTSQFFITYAATPHLNEKHSVFGKIIGGEKVLDACENVGTDEKDLPVKPEIIIESIRVITDPFEEWANHDQKVETARAEKAAEREKRQRLSMISSGTTASTDTIGKYLNTSSLEIGKSASTIAVGGKNELEDSSFDNLPPAKKKQKAMGSSSFSKGFSNW